MRHPKTARALGAALTTLGAFAALPALAQDATPPAPQAPPATSPNVPAAGPGPATQPGPAPGTVQPGPTQPAPQTPPPAGAPAAAPTPPPNYGIQTSGLIDGYYLYQFSSPRFNATDNVSAPAIQPPGTVATLSGHNNNLGTPFPNVRQNAPSLALAELNVFANPRPNNVGFKVTLIAGDYADLNHFGFTAYAPGAGFSTSGTGESRYKNVQQAYLTYALGGDGSGIDFGKFYTPFGYEVTESNADYNETRSLPYLIIPTYHAGARIYAANAFTKGLTATFYLVNALFNTTTAGVADDNKQPGFIGQLNYAAPSGKFTLISELGLGKDKLPGFTGSNYIPLAVTNWRDTINDNNFTYNFSSTVLGGLDYEYVQEKPNGGPTITANGYAVYYRNQFKPKDAIALRFSGFSEKTNAFDGSNSTFSSGSTTTDPYEFTATYEYKATAAFTTRFEYRHDHTNNTSILPLASGAGVSHDQDIALVSGDFTF